MTSTIHKPIGKEDVTDELANECVDEFLQSWYNWATNGAPDNSVANNAPDKIPYFRRFGLCTNLTIWTRETGLSYIDGHLIQALEQRFLLSVGEPSIPFGANNYHKRCTNNNQHECPHRLAWVREQLGIEQTTH